MNAHYKATQPWICSTPNSPTVEGQESHLDTRDSTGLTEQVASLYRVTGSFINLKIS